MPCIQFASLSLPRSLQVLSSANASPRPSQAHAAFRAKTLSRLSSAGPHLALVGVPSWSINSHLIERPQSSGQAMPAPRHRRLRRCRCWVATQTTSRSYRGEPVISHDASKTTARHRITALRVWGGGGRGTAVSRSADHHTKAENQPVLCVDHEHRVVSNIGLDSFDHRSSRDVHYKVRILRIL